MACLGSDSNHRSPLLPQCQPEAEWAGILMDEHVRPRHLSLLLCRSAGVVATRVRSRSLGHLLLVPGWKLGLLTGGKTAKTNRAEAWRSYRGQDCENKQDRGLDIIQGGMLGEESGRGLGYQTDGRAAKIIRVDSGTFRRGKAREECQAILSVLIDALAVAGLPCQTCGKAGFVTDIAMEVDRYLAASCSSSYCIVGRDVI
jgi:hypothetical protein